MESLTAKLSRNFSCRLCEGDVIEAVEYEKLSDEVETVKEFSYFGDGVIPG